MNKSDTLTCQKVMIPVRLTPELYRAMMDHVQSEKKNEHGYSWPDSSNNTAAETA